MSDNDCKRPSPKEDVKESPLDVLIVDTDEGGADVVLTGKSRQGKAKGRSVSRDSTIDGS